MRIHSARLFFAVLFSVVPQYAHAASGAHAGGEAAAQPVASYAVQAPAASGSTSAHDGTAAPVARGSATHVVGAGQDGPDVPYGASLGRFNAATVEAPAATPAAGIGRFASGAANAARSFANYLAYADPGAPVEALLGRAYLEINPEFSYALNYENNIDYNTSDKLSDFSNNYLPGIRLTASSPRFTLESKANLDITEYISEKQFNCVDQRYTTIFTFKPSERLSFSFTGGYFIVSNINRYFETDDGSDVLYDYYRRYKDKTKSFSGTVTYALSQRSTLGLVGYTSIYDTLTTDSSDFYGVTASYSYSISPRSNLLLSGAYFYYNFSYKLQALQDEADDEDLDFFYSLDYTIKNYALSTGFDHTFETDFKLRVTAGFRYTTADYSASGTDENGEKFKESLTGSGNGWTATFDLQRRFSDFLFKFQGVHDISVDSRGSSYESTRFYLSTTYDITRRLAARLMLRYQRSFADASDEEFSNAQDRNTYYISTSLHYKLYRWLNVKVGHSYRYSDNKESGVTVSGNLVSITLQFIPLRPLVIR